MSPLIQWSSKSSIGKNIKKLISEGYPERQAKAIALNVAKDINKKRKKK